MKNNIFNKSFLILLLLAINSKAQDSISVIDINERLPIPFVKFKYLVGNEIIQGVSTLDGKVRLPTNLLNYESLVFYAIGYKRKVFYRKDYPLLKRGIVYLKQGKYNKAKDPFKTGKVSHLDSNNVFKCISIK